MRIKWLVTLPIWNFQAIPMSGFAYIFKHFAKFPLNYTWMEIKKNNKIPIEIHHLLSLFGIRSSKLNEFSIFFPSLTPWIPSSTSAFALKYCWAPKIVLQYYSKSLWRLCMSYSMMHVNQMWEIWLVIKNLPLNEPFYCHLQ